MRCWMLLTLTAATLALVTFAEAQPPGGGGKDKKGKGGKGFDVEATVNQMMEFDKNKDGKLTKSEITDERLLRLFERADANKDGVVTREELVTLFTQEAQAGGGDFGPGGPGGKGGKGGKGGEKGGKGDKGGFGPPPRPGQILPDFLQEELKLTADQKKSLEALQKEVDTKLGKILTADQNKVLKKMQEGGFGPP